MLVGWRVDYLPDELAAAAFESEDALISLMGWYVSLNGHFVVQWSPLQILVFPIRRNQRKNNKPANNFSSTRCDCFL